MTGETPGAVLITGCSTGIGRATAFELASRGWEVWATVHRPRQDAELEAAGCRVRTLDVTSPADVEKVVAEIEETHGSIAALVNNAGYGLQVPVEEMGRDDVRTQFETNVFGPLYLTQLVLPGMRRQRKGRIVNVSSVGGRISIPGGGAYHATKHSIEVLSDTLRFEVAGYGIQVVVVQPGAISTNWINHAVSTMEEHRTRVGPYADLYDAMEKRLVGAHTGVLRLLARPPEAVAKVIRRALEIPHPKTRYAVPRSAGLFMTARRVMSDRMWDAFLRRLYPSPGADSRGRDAGEGAS